MFAVTALDKGAGAEVIALGAAGAEEAGAWLPSGALPVFTICLGGPLAGFSAGAFSRCFAGVVLL